MTATQARPVGLPNLTVPAGRRADVDWLRVGAVYLLFLFHTGKVFDKAPFYAVKNPVPTPGLDAFTGFIHLWHMPLFFALAGWSIHASLRGRSPGAFSRERVTRVLLPAAVTLLLTVTVIKYLSLGREPGFDESFLEFLPTFWAFERFTWEHLWFVVYLLVFTFLSLPVLRRLEASHRTIDRFPLGALFLAAVPFVVVQTTLRAWWPGWQNLYDDWANFAYYLMFFLGGYLIARFPEIEARIHADWRKFAAVGAGSALGLLALDLGGVGTDAFGPGWFVAQPLDALAGFGFVVAAFGFAHAHLRRENRALVWLSESAFPVYLLHQVAVVVMAVLVVDTALPIPAKFTLVCAGAIVLTVSAYELVVSRTRLTRFLFGVRRHRRPAPA
ncbi:MAG: acyltransferase [Acidimicrobiia bacterium]|nr:acyltransferase [Acidimicrobiia bacterium]